MFLRPGKVIRNSIFLSQHYPNEKWDIKHLGNPIINDLKVITLEKDPSVKFVLKRYGSTFSLIKWTLIKFLTFYASDYTVNSKNRTLNEIKGLHWCQKKKILVPQFHDRIGSTVLIDFVRGTPTDEYDKFPPMLFFSHFKHIGIIIAKIHISGAVIGDCKAENIFYGHDNEYYFLDLEQFKVTNPDEVRRRIWDITELFFYLGHFYPFKERYPFLKKAIMTFLKSYFNSILSSNLSDKTKINLIKEFGKLRYTLIYLTFMSPLTFKFILGVIKDFKTKYLHVKS